MVKFNWKKKIAKALVFAMAIGTVGVHGMNLKSPMVVRAEGEDPKAPTIDIEYSLFKAYIESENDDNFLFLEVLKDDQAAKPASATYCFPADGGYVEVDLSFLKVTKPSYLRVYGDSNMTLKSEVVTVSAQPKKEAIKYVAGSDEVLKSFTIGGSNPKDAAELGAYNVKTLYGSWEEVELVTEGKDPKTQETTYEVHDEVLQMLRITGTTLIFQKKATTDAKDKDGKITTAGTPAGPEIKVKVAAIAKAPKITVDYPKNVIKLSKGTEYSIVGATKEIEVGEGDDKKKESVQNWVDCANGASLSPLDIIIEAMGLEDKGEGDSKVTKEEQAQALFEAEAGVTLMVRTKADSAKKKSASQPAFLSLKASKSIDKVGTNQVAVQDYDTKKEEKPTKYLTYENTEKGIKLTATGVGFDYSVDDGKTWKTVKAGANTTVKGTTALTVRTSGVKPNEKQNIKEAFPSNQVPIVAPAVTPDWDDKELVVTAGKGNTLTFSAKAGDPTYKATVAGSATYEYRAATDKEDDTKWAKIPDAGLSAGDYQIRVAAVDKVTGASAPKDIKLPAIPEAPKG